MERRRRRDEAVVVGKFLSNYNPIKVLTMRVRYVCGFVSILVTIDVDFTVTRAVQKKHRCRIEMKIKVDDPCEEGAMC